MGGVEDAGTKCIFVARNRDTRMVMSSVVPLKGVSHEFPARRVRAFISELGFEHTKWILKSDRERMRSPAERLKVESPVGSSASNGMVESGVQTVQGQVRVLKDAFETRISTKVDGSHNIISWMIEIASVLVNRHEVGHDGKTPYGRSRGKKSRLLGLELGEILNFKRAKPAGKLAKLDIRWSDGVFFGVPFEQRRNDRRHC